MNEELLFRYVKGDTTPEEDLVVAEWLAADRDAHMKKLKQVRFIYQFSVLNGDMIDRQLQEEAVGHRTRALSWRRIGRAAAGMAAAVLIFMVGGYVAERITYRSLNRQFNVFQAPKGQRVHVTLSDGSNIWLNSGARLEYPVVFEEKIRKVRLSGEAMFEVEHDSDRPFEVETFASNIRVLGTKFNVVADEFHQRFTTTLLQGKVKISNRLDPRQQEIVMHPDDVVNLSHGHLFVETLKDSEAMLWTEGLISISGLSFAELMAKFEQAFDVEIVISRKTLPDMGKLSGKIRVNDGIENALHILQYAADFRYVRNPETNVVTIY